MQAAVRQQIRAAIDQHKRQALAQARGQTSNLGNCSSCGCDRDTYTVGCKRCSDRRYNRTRRQDPVYLEHERQVQRAKRARRKATA